MIEARGLTRRYGRLVAAEELSFAIGRGEVVGLLGVNGAGKSTTLRMLAGALPPSSGTALVAGHDVARDSLEVRRRIGYLPESVPLPAELRVEELLAHQGRLHGLAGEGLERRIAAVLAQVHLTDRRRALVGQLSKGLRQRAGLAVALLHEPEVLLLDEPTSGLDPLQRVEVRALVRELARDRTVLLSSHVLAEVEAVSRRVIVLHEGRIAADGTPDELARRLGGSRVRVEAVVGSDPDAAARLLASLPGAREVRARGRLGIHHVFDVVCDEDLREDVGALAAQRGWALRELSWRRPTLEQLFARIALGIEGDAEEEAAPAPAPAPAAATVELAAPDASAAPTAPPGAPRRVGRTLNPFERPPSA